MTYSGAVVCTKNTVQPKLRVVAVTHERDRFHAWSQIQAVVIQLHW